VLVGLGLACCSGGTVIVDLPTPAAGLPVTTAISPTVSEVTNPSPQALTAMATPSAELCTETPVRVETTPTATPVSQPSVVAASQQVHRSSVQVTTSDGVTATVSLGSLLYLPRGYAQVQKNRWPLIVFLHGSEERGDDPDVLRTTGLPQALEQGLDLPALVLSPQCPLGMRWWQWTEALGALLDRIESEYLVDRQRVYLTGFSMGAYGAWALALRFPEHFAAMAPVAGGCDFRDDSIPAEICDLKELPVWAFHGAQDTTVAPRESENAVNALRACGGDVRLTLYPNVDHIASSEITYADRALYGWLFDHTRASSQ